MPARSHAKKVPLRPQPTAIVGDEVHPVKRSHKRGQGAGIPGRTSPFPRRIAPAVRSISAAVWPACSMRCGFEVMAAAGNRDGGFAGCGIVGVGLARRCRRAPAERKRRGTGRRR